MKPSYFFESHNQERFKTVLDLWPLMEHHHHYELQVWWPDTEQWVFVESWSHAAPSITSLLDKLAFIKKHSHKWLSMARLIDCFGGFLLVVIVDGDVCYITDMYPPRPS